MHRTRKRKFLLKPWISISTSMRNTTQASMNRESEKGRRTTKWRNWQDGYFICIIDFQYIFELNKQQVLMFKVCMRRDGRLKIA